jgi:hypothetical protein
MKKCSYSEPEENKKRPPAQETGGPSSSFLSFLFYEFPNFKRKK